MVNKQAQISLLDEIIVDNFAGGGGASTGIELAAGRPVSIAINHDPDAILMHKTNHPYTDHYQESVWDIDPVQVCGGRKVGLAWFSPDCKHFSKAKGGKPVNRNIRGLAWIVLKWAGLVRPRVIILENVEEFQTWGPVKRGKPIKSKAGMTFERWKSQLAALGYKIDHRELIAADYGAPTIRKRFFLVARCDGKPIRWPEPTHSKDGAGGLKRWCSAAEIIDWTVPCPSIFDTKQEIKSRYGQQAVRPLADNTMRRIARGLDKFVLRAGKPFIVQVNHSGEFRGQGTEEPLQTITGKHGYGVCTPVMTAIGQNGFSQDRSYSPEEPVRTVVSKAEQCVLSPCLIQYHTEQSENVRGQAINEPIMTVDAANRYAIDAAFLTEYYGGADHGQQADRPLHTSTSHDRQGIALAHIAEFKGQDKGQDCRMPLRTITASAGEFGVVQTKITTVCDLWRWSQVREMLNQYCGYSIADDEILLLNIAGTQYFISDIGLRMLTPRELYAANGFPPDYIIDRDYMGNVYSKSKQVARCGNAVPPPFATALVRANMPEWCGDSLETMKAFEKTVAI